MKENKSEQELARQLRAQQHEAEQDHKDKCEKTHIISKRSALGISIIIFILTIGVVNSIHEKKINSLILEEKQQRGLNRETLFNVRGLLQDDTRLLFKASNIMIKRNDGVIRGATWLKDWSINEKKLFISSASKLGHTNILNWISSQPSWKTGLSQELCELVQYDPARLGKYTAIEWRQKYYDLKKHHYNEVFHEEFVDLEQTEVSSDL